MHAQRLGGVDAAAADTAAWRLRSVIHLRYRRHAGPWVRPPRTFPLGPLKLYVPPCGNNAQTRNYIAQEPTALAQAHRPSGCPFFSLGLAEGGSASGCAVSRGAAAPFKGLRLRARSRQPHRPHQPGQGTAGAEYCRERRLRRARAAQAAWLPASGCPPPAELLMTGTAVRIATQPTRAAGALSNEPLEHLYAVRMPFSSASCPQCAG